ncbi:phenylalanine--tRNA ligase subunit beta [Brevibacillus laterosporus]|uniref:phenylalanine--tRNA ligase subunit beta n=1 Tax=Brevibacillus laterosporus TaxID=1465 RepID=UPI0018CE656D|nr:phenylalanine--tRNA ligase subunit beta [Brevibacillus laterosporus]MBG9796375.1 phenylalanyl-tRNA synthase subunit beta [Brevibacillus laterosporus]MCR8937388.1 phenylalanine--tRNA ligase subunit beta [Brevibacillus laterosporus]MCZ0840027.1 phenylalanine--tRNA ligase subunit beta [Brevibacillus laterosporus]MCZ0843403.1 phenylalanine--tRNA ligase subunit beta [Brevibacillus laterosporus]MED1910053.1 phenylalanine--tRNA ligase subunit beta [Brevibacillus laterosporus]
MKVSYQWLKEYVDLTDITPQDLAEKMTRSGIEVEGVESLNKGVTGVVIGYVQEREKHPDADRLSVLKVDVGQEELLQIVCGAQNVAQGQKVPVAMIGAVLPENFKIKKSKLRGVESQGMICSAKELGLNDKLLPKDQQEGILVLPEDAELGADATEFLGLNDYVLELGLTPNRSDCLSMLGVAYEVAALYGREVKLPDTSVTEDGEANPVTVAIEASEHCYQYVGRHFTDAVITSAPQWMKNRLMAAGTRPINNVVDITNYVLLEYGQPLHTFDAKEVADQQIIVRLAQENEKLTTLDDQERALDPEALVIADKEKGLGIAGVMGGANSEIVDNTKEIILESAYFTPASIRRTSKMLNLRTEGCVRWEKGVDQSRVSVASDRAAHLIQKLAHAKVSKGVAEQTITVNQPAVVPVSLTKINEHLGTSITKEQVADIFTRLQFTFDQTEGALFTVTVPTRRGDITLSEDLIEEVARLYGYDRIPVTLPGGESIQGKLTKEQQLRRITRHHLIGTGLSETISYALLHPDKLAQFSGLQDERKLHPVPLAMPISEEHSVLRTNLLASLVETATYNKNRQNQDLAFFELGHVFLSEQEELTEQPEQRLYLGGLVTGQWMPVNWMGVKAPVDFYTVKGLVESLFSRLGINSLAVTYTANKNRKGMHPGRTADVMVEGEVIGYVGQLHPKTEKDHDLDETYVFQFDLQHLFSFAADLTDYKPLPKFPAITRDLALVVERNLPVAQLEAIIREESGELLESVTLFDIYMGERIASDKKSVAYSIVYRHPERTLQDEEVQEITGKVIEALTKVGAELRS